MFFLINVIATFYDKLHAFWKSRRVAYTINGLFIFSFFVAAIGGLLNSLNLLPSNIAFLFFPSPFSAIKLAFSFILAQEIIELIFAISDSISRAVGKQLEIMALIMLRECFVDISQLEAISVLSENYFMLLQIGSSALAGVLLFIFRGIFFQLYVSRNHKNITSYIATKKVVSLLLFCLFVMIGCFHFYEIFFLKIDTSFFHLFYSALVFTDILLLLISQCYLGSFYDTFRYSGYAVCTLLMRLALGAPHYIAAVLCVFSGLLLLLLTWAIKKWSGDYYEKQLISSS